MSEYYYAILDNGTAVSVSSKEILDPSLFGFSANEFIYELKIDGDSVDSHKCETIPKSGSMFAILDQGNKKRSIRVNVSVGMLNMKYELLIDDVEVELKKNFRIRIENSLA